MSLWLRLLLDAVLIAALIANVRAGRRMRAARADYVRAAATMHDALMRRSEQVCPYVIQSDEGTAYCRLAAQGHEP